MRYGINQTTPDPPWHHTPTPVTQCLIALGSQELQTARKGPDVKVRDGSPEAELELSTWGCCSSTDWLLRPQVLPHPSGR